MVTLADGLRSLEPTGSLLVLLRHALALLVALLGGTLVLLPLVGRPRLVELARVLHDPRAQAAFATPGERLARRLHRRLLAGLQRRLARAGLARVPRAVVPLAMGAGGLATAGLAGTLLPVPPVVLLAGLLGLTLPWLWLGRRARERQRLLSQQVVDLLWVLISALANGESVTGALLEAAEQGVRAPLRGPLRRALFDLIPTRGVARPLRAVLASLDEELACAAFTLAERTIAAHLQHSADGLPGSLERVATLAQQELADAAEARGDFALARATATFIFFVLPAVLTVVLHGVLPSAVEAAYGGPWGWAVATALVGWSVLGYRVATAGERAALAEAPL